MIRRIKNAITAGLIAVLAYAVFPAARSAHAFSSNSWATYYAPKRARPISIDGDLSGSPPSWSGPLPPWLYGWQRPGCLG